MKARKKKAQRKQNRRHEKRTELSPDAQRAIKACGQRNLYLLVEGDWWRVYCSRTGMVVGTYWPKSRRWLLTAGGRGTGRHFGDFLRALQNGGDDA